MFRLFNSTDGVWADPRSFRTKEQAERAAEEFRGRYYLTADGRRIAPTEVELEVREG